MDNEENLENLYSYMDGNKRYLKEVINRINDNKVVPFIGAGMSSPIYPTWKGFFSVALSSNRIHPSAKKEIGNLLADNKYERAASILETALGKAGYIDIIRSEFSEEKIEKSKLSEMPISLIPHIFKNSTVITTNFDRLLDTVFSNAGYSFKDTITPYESSDVAKGDFAVGIVNYLLKLHGDYMRPDKIVFTEEQYDDCYGKDLDSKYVSFITDALSSRVLLFLGCSLAEDRTMKLLEKIALTKTRTHYAVLECDSNIADIALSDTFYMKQKRLSDMGIRVIWYPKGEHEYVYAVLKEIKKN